MAIVKVLFRKQAARTLRYVFGHSQPGDEVDSQDCPPHQDGAISEFKATRDQHDFKGDGDQVIHVIQSWNEAESKKLTPEKVNEMGRSLIENYFKGHQFVIVTHTDTGKLHNHIVVNRVNMETGLLIEKKYHHLHKLRARNDEICLANGLSIPNQDATLRQARMPEAVKHMVRSGRASWIWDTKNKADLARFLATDFDQYVGYLGALGINARVEDKNITYFYPGRSRGKRGDKLGKHYDKSGLMEQFKVNDERFKQNPEVRAKIWRSFEDSSNRGGHPVRNAGDLLLGAGIPHGEIPKDYAQFTKTARRPSPSLPASERRLGNGIVPFEEIARAKRSILEYCQQQKIPLHVNDKGQTVLRDRNFVIINGAEAINTKNNTQANLIDFVAAHHNLTLLQAVARINGNPDLLSIEKHFGAVKRNYTSFYIPKPDQMPFAKATEHLSRFLRSQGAHSKGADSLLKHQRAEVSKSGVIRVFGESDSGGALEFTEGPGNAWSEKKQGVFRSPFYKRAPRGNEMYLFTDPKSYLARTGAHPFSERSHNNGILALMEPDISKVDHYLKEHPGIKRISLMKPKGREFNQAELDFFGVLKSRFEPFGLRIESITHTKSLSPEGPELSF